MCILFEGKDKSEKTASYSIGLPDIGEKAKFKKCSSSSNVTNEMMMMRKEMAGQNKVQMMEQPLKKESATMNGRRVSRKRSWVEDFTDLQHYCDPIAVSNIRDDSIKMEPFDEYVPSNDNPAGISDPTFDLSFYLDEGGTEPGLVSAVQGGGGIACDWLSSPQIAMAADGVLPAKSFKMDALTNGAVFSPVSVQSPSISQSNLEEESGVAVFFPRTERKKLELEIPVSYSGGGNGMCINTPEVLNSFSRKNPQDFDLLSYVFEDKSVELDAPDPLQETGFVPQGGRGVKKAFEMDDDEGEEEEEGVGESGRDSAIIIEETALVESGKYRQLRSKNNEASRRSRANRKTRDVEMQREADELEAENKRLKAKAREMETAIGKMRAAMLRIVRCGSYGAVGVGGGHSESS